MSMPFTTIKGVSERRRLPRLGKIRLGVKVLAKSGQTYPAEVDYFVVPPEVQKVYGPKPKALEVMFPVQDRGIIFPQALKWYGSGRGLKCIGDGERAMRLNDATGTMEPMDCPCPLLDQGHCARRAHLMVILPKVNMGGVYQIDMGSYNSIVDLNSGLDYVESLVGRIAMVPLVLTRVPRETFGGGQRRVHYPLQISLATNDLQWINRLRTETAVILERQAAFVLPAPADENPAFDDGAVVVPESELAAAGAADPAPAEEPAGQPIPAPAPAAHESPATPAALPAAAPQAEAQGAQPPATGRNGAPARQGPLPDQPRGAAPNGRSSPNTAGQGPKPISKAQEALIRKLCAERHIPADRVTATLRGMTSREASQLLDAMLKRQDYSLFELAAEDEESY